MFATIVIDLDPNLFQVGPFLITWHGVFSVLGILAAARVGQILLQRDGVAPERVYDMAVWMVIAGLIGAGSGRPGPPPDRKSKRLNSSHLGISYAVFCL